VDFAKFNNWLQVSANIGIVAGLVLVGVQLKQNSDLLKTQLLYEESHRSVELETEVIGEHGAKVWAKSIKDPRNLSLEEQRIMEALLWSFTEQLRATRLLGELGLLEDDEWRLRVNAETEFYFGNRYGTAWWKSFSTDNNALSKDLIDAVNVRLSEISPDSTIEYMDRTIELVDVRAEDQESAESITE
jgi:hypothetical protein